MLLCCYCTTNAALGCINEALEGLTEALNIEVKSMCVRMRPSMCLEEPFHYFVNSCLLHREKLPNFMRSVSISGETIYHS